MAITKIQSESLNLADNYDFTGTVTGAGGVNTPAFEAYLSSDQTSSSVTNDKIQYDTKVFDVGGCFNNTGSTATLNGISVPSYSFAPNVAGKYFIYTNLAFRNGLSGFEYGEVGIYKNGTSYRQLIKDNRNNYAGYYNSVPINAIFELNGTSDYVNIYGLLSYVTTFIITGFNGVNKRSYFGAYKIIE